MDRIDIKYFNYYPRCGILCTKPKGFLPNMNTTTLTKLTLPLKRNVRLTSQTPFQPASQQDRKDHLLASLSRWPAKAKQ